jgi:hypothetical protein
MRSSVPCLQLCLQSTARLSMHLRELACKSGLRDATRVVSSSLVALQASESPLRGAIFQLIVLRLSAHSTNYSDEHPCLSSVLRQKAVENLKKIDLQCTGQIQSSRHETRKIFVLVVRSGVSIQGLWVMDMQ